MSECVSDNVEVDLESTTETKFRSANSFGRCYPHVMFNVLPQSSSHSVFVILEFFIFALYQCIWCDGEHYSRSAQTHVSLSRFTIILPY